MHGFALSVTFQVNGKAYCFIIPANKLEFAIFKNQLLITMLPE